MKRFWIDFTVGIFVIIGVLALVFLSFRVGNLSGQFNAQESYRVSAEFENIGSVRVGSPVKSAGIVVGEVSAVHLNPKNYRGILILAISNQYAFPRDSEIAVMTSGLLGEQYLSIQAGIESTMLKNGDRFEYSQPALVLEKLIGQVMLSLTGKKDNKPPTNP